MAETHTAWTMWRIQCLLLIGLSLGLSILDVANAQARHASSPELTDQERAWLAAGHRVRVRISDYPPYMIREPRPMGLAVDYLDHIAAQFDLEIEYVPANMTFGAAMADLAGSRQHYDVLPTFTRTPEREKQFAVTADYLSAPWVIYTRQDSPYLIGLESLAGKTLAAEKGFLIIDKLKRDVPDVNILEVPIALDALMALATGQADAYVGNLAVGSYLVKEHRLTNLMVAAPTHYGINTQAMAVRSDWPELASLISKGIASMTLKDRNAILGKWIHLEMQPRRDYRLAFSILAGASLVIIAVFLWNRRLAREILVRQRVESELRRSEARLLEETNSLQQTKVELQHKKDELQAFNANLEARLLAAVEDRTRVLNQAAARAKESDQAKSAFLSAVSHELRSPLHDILGYAGLLTRQIPQQARHQLDIISESGHQLLRLINDILDYSRGEVSPIPLEPGPLSLVRLTRQLTATYRPVAERGKNQFVVELKTGDLDWVIADEMRLTQILRNLLDNAFKFTRDGRIELAIELIEARTLKAEAGAGAGEREGAEAAAEEGTMGADCLVRFRVSDTGVGIPASKQETVFQPFQRLERHRSLPGVGLGLAIAQQLTTAMGGSIRLRSQSGPDSGSTFCFELRLPMGAQLEQDADEDLFIVGYSGRRLTLLVADDQATSRGFLSECCRGWGFEVIEAADGAEAVACFQALETPVDAVLVDQFMPRLDGWGCLQALRGMERGRQLPVILFSAVPAQRPAGYPEAIRFDGFAMKPLTESTLARLLAESLALDWEYEVASSTAEAPQPDPALLSASLTAEERARLRAMVAMGQVIGLQQWATAMATQDVGRKPMWQGIEQLCRALDLQALQRLAAASSDD
ncbi:MAG: transporter substrate-binding domain-containing protein [Chromatiaceae bacterium]|nr:transporter substrate-binding domain-containing protein [Chromatiaceae bacterium]MCF7994512.1 transporter substrate-binding domain-containing protein [Chromatiaceae bacterium]MCF8005085.1 transporter substrate-binding domain-containing protein [Chromatiaceae bacterium]